MGDIKTASLEEIRKMKKSGEVYAAHVDAVEADLADNFFEKAVTKENLKRDS